VPLRLQTDRSPAGPNPAVLAFLQRVLKNPNAVQQLSNALTSLSVAPTPMGMASKGPELGAELSGEELDVLGDLFGTAASGKKAAGAAAGKAPKLLQSAPAEATKPLEGALGRPNPTEQWRAAAAASEKPEPFRSIPGEGALNADELKERVAGIETARGYLKQLKLLSPKANYALDTALGMLRKGEAAKADALIQSTLRASLGSK